LTCGRPSCVCPETAEKKSFPQQTHPWTCPKGCPTPHSNTQVVLEHLVSKYEPQKCAVLAKNAITPQCATTRRLSSHLHPSPHHSRRCIARVSHSCKRALAVRCNSILHWVRARWHRNARNNSRNCKKDGSAAVAPTHPRALLIVCFVLSPGTRPYA